ncbi:MAG: lysophospholipid acyltransferase family protein, partial [Candidatus Eutrophobiaceae bacterium]
MRRSRRRRRYTLHVIPHLRALCFYLGMVAFTLLYFPISMLMLAAPFPLRCWMMTHCWTQWTLWWLALCCGVRCQVIGRENIPKQSGVVLCKHQSVWETFMLQFIFHPHIWALKRELLWMPIHGWGLATMHPIAIDRGSPIKALRKILREGEQHIRLGRWVILFPEGTRTAPGQTRKYLPGGALLAQKCACPIVPVAHNAGHLWMRNSFVKKPGTITLVIGKPIDGKAWAGKRAEDLNREVQTWIEDTVASLPNPEKS